MGPSANPPPQWLDDLFEHVVKFSTKHDLCTLSRVNKFVSESALRALYGSITLDQRPDPRQDLNALSSEPRRPPAQRCLETLASYGSRASLVHSLNIQWQRQTIGEAESMLAEEFGALLKACLVRLVNLKCLSLDFNVFETFPALNDTFPFELVQFSTTLPWNEDLITFLANQSSTLRDLRLDCNSESNDIPLQNYPFPAIKVFHWGGNAKVEILSTMLERTWRTLELVHVKFADTKAVEDVVDMLRKYPTIPSKLVFAFEVQGALGRVSGLQTEELSLGGPYIIGAAGDLTVGMFFGFCPLITELGYRR